MTIHIDRSLFNNGYIPLTIDLPDSSSPSRYGSTERRVLGFYFLSLHVRADNTLALSLQRLFSLNPIPRRVAAACHGPRRVATEGKLGTRERAIHSFGTTFPGSRGLRISF